MKKLLFISLLFTCSLAYTTTAQAGPVIAGISGTLTHNASVDITASGSSFGTKSPAEPIVYHDFENGVDGQLLDTAKPNYGIQSGNYDWELGGTTQKPTYSDVQNPTNSTLTARCIWYDESPTQSRCWFGKGQFFSPVSDEFYIYYKRYFIPSTESVTTSNIKHFYAFGDAGDNFPQGMVLIPAGNDAWAYYGNTSGTQKWFSPWLNQSSTINTWNTWEIYNKLEVPYTATNGILKAWVDGVQYLGILDYAQRTIDNLFEDFRLGDMYQMNDGDDDGIGYCYYDNVYIDNTQSRVMIGDVLTFSGCIHREIQIPTAWTSSAISVTVNRGAFGAAVGAYLFVIDSNGVVSDQDIGTDGYQGFPITFGGEGEPAGDETPPYVSGRNPDANDTNVATDTNIVLHILDTGVGVDGTTVVITVETVDETANFDRVGDASDYTYTLTGNSFANDQVVNVTVDADDNDGNSMSQDVYDFTVVSATPPSPPAVTGRAITVGGARISPGGAVFSVK